MDVKKGKALLLLRWVLTFFGTMAARAALARAMAAGMERGGRARKGTGANEVEVDVLWGMVRIKWRSLAPKHAPNDGSLRVSTARTPLPGTPESPLNTPYYRLLARPPPTPMRKSVVPSSPKRAPLRDLANVKSDHATTLLRKSCVL